MALEIWTTRDAAGMLEWLLPETQQPSIAMLARRCGRVYSCRIDGAVGFSHVRSPEIRAFLSEVIPGGASWIVGEQELRPLLDWSRPLTWRGRACCAVVRPSRRLESWIADAREEEAHQAAARLRARHARAPAPAPTGRAATTLRAPNGLALADARVLTDLVQCGEYLTLWARPDGWSVFVTASEDAETDQRVLAAATRHADVKLASDFGSLPTT